MSKDEAIKVYNFSVLAPGLCGGKRSTKSDIRPLPDYAEWRNYPLKTGLGYDIKKKLDPVHWDIKMIIVMQYQTYPLIRALATEMAAKAV